MNTRPRCDMHMIFDQTTRLITSRSFTLTCAVNLAIAMSLSSCSSVDQTSDVEGANLLTSRPWFSSEPQTFSPGDTVALRIHYRPTTRGKGYSFFHGEGAGFGARFVVLGNKPDTLLEGRDDNRV